MRHGEPVGGRRYRGQIDDPLSDKGWQQMHQAVAEHAPWEFIVSSSLSRCADFARELANRHRIDMRLEERFRELGFGDWEGKSSAEINAADPQTVARFLRDPLENTPAGAETLAAFEQRVIGAWHELIEQQRGRHILVVGHAGQMRMILRHVLAMPLDSLFRIQVSNAAISRIQVEADGFARLVFHDGRL